MTSAAGRRKRNASHTGSHSYHLPCPTTKPHHHTSTTQTSPSITSLLAVVPVVLFLAMLAIAIGVAASPTASQTKTASHSVSSTTSSSRTESHSRTRSLSRSVSQSRTDTRSKGTVTSTTSASLTATQSRTKSTTDGTATATTSHSAATRSLSITSSATKSVTSSLSAASHSNTNTQTVSRSLSASYHSATRTLSASVTHSQTIGSRSGTMTKSGPTSTLSATQSNTHTLSTTQSKTNTQTLSRSSSATRTLSASATLSQSIGSRSSTMTTSGPTSTLSTTRSNTHTSSATRSFSISGSITTSNSHTLLQSVSAGTATSSVTVSSSNSSSATVTSSWSRSSSASASFTLSASQTASLSSTSTISKMKSFSLSSFFSNSATASASQTSSSSMTRSQSTSITDSGSKTATGSLSRSESHSTSRSYSSSQTSSHSVTLSTSLSRSSSTTLSKSRTASETFSALLSSTISNSSSRTHSASFSNSLSTSDTRSNSKTMSSSGYSSASLSSTTSTSLSASSTATTSKSMTASASSSATTSGSASLTASLSTSGSRTLLATKSSSASSSGSTSASTSLTVTSTSSNTTSQSVSGTGTVSHSASTSSSQSSTISTSNSLSRSASGISSASISASASQSTTATSSLSSTHSLSGSESSSFTNTSSTSGTVSMSATASSTQSSTQSLSQSTSLSITASSSGTRSVSRTSSGSTSETTSVTISRSHSKSLSASASSSQTHSVTASASETTSKSTSTTGTASGTISTSSSASASLTSSRSKSDTMSLSAAASQSATMSRSTTGSMSLTTSLSLSETSSLSSTTSASVTTSSSASTSKTTSSTRSFSESITSSTSNTSTSSMTESSSGSSSGTSSQSATGTASNSSSLSMSVSPSKSASGTDSATASATSSESTSSSVSHSLSSTHTSSSTMSSSNSDSYSLSHSKSNSATLSTSSSKSLTRSISASASQTGSTSKTQSLSMSDSASATSSTSHTASSTQTATGSQSSSVSSTPSFSSSPSASSTSSGSFSTSTTTTQSYSQSGTASGTLSATLSHSLTSSHSASTSTSDSTSSTATSTDSTTNSISRTSSVSASSSTSPSLSHSPSFTMLTSTSQSQSRSTSASQSATLSASLSGSTSVTNTSSLSITTTASVSGSTSASFSTSYSSSATTTLTASNSISATSSASVTGTISTSQSTSGSTTSSPSASASPTATISLSSTTSKSASTSHSTSTTATDSSTLSASPTATASPSSTTSGSTSSSLSSSNSSSLTISATRSASSTTSDSVSSTSSVSVSASASFTASLSRSTTLSSSTSMSRSTSLSSSASATSSASTSVSHSASGSGSTSTSPTASSSPTMTTSESSSHSSSLTFSESLTRSSSASVSESTTGTTTASTSVSASHSTSGSTSVSGTSSLSGTGSTTASASTSHTTSASPSASSTPTSSSSLSLSTSTSQTASGSSSDSQSATTSASASQSQTASPSASASPTASGSSSQSTTQTPSASASPSLTSSNTASSTTSRSASETTTASGSSSVSVSMSQSSSASASTSATLSDSASLSPTSSTSPSLSGSPTASLSQSTSVSLTSSLSSSTSDTASGSTTTSLSPTSSGSPTFSSSLSTTSSTSMSGSASSSSTSSASETSSVSATNSTSSSLTTSPSTSDSGTATLSTSHSDSASATTSASLSVTTSASTTDSHSLSQSSSATASMTASTSTSSSSSFSSSASMTRSATPTATVSPTTTGSNSVTGSMTPSVTSSPSASASPSSSLSLSPSSSMSPSSSTSGSVSTTLSPSASSSPTSTASPTSSGSTSESSSQSISSSTSQSSSLSVSGTMSSSESASASLTATTSGSSTATASPTKSASSSASSSGTITESGSTSASGSISASTSESTSDSLTSSESGTEEVSLSRSPTLSFTASDSQSLSSSASATISSTASTTSSISTSSSFTLSDSSSITSSASDSETSSASASFSVVESTSLSATSTKSFSASSTITTGSETMSLTRTPFRPDVIRVMPPDLTNGLNTTLYVHDNISFITLNESQSWVKVGFGTTWFNDTNITDPDLLFIMEGFYIRSVIDIDYEHTYTTYLDCIDYIPCHINLTSPTTAGIHLVTFFFNYKLGPANDTRPPKYLYIKKVLDPIPKAGSLSIDDTVFPNYTSSVSPFQVGVELVTQSERNIPSTFETYIGDNAIVSLTVAPILNNSLCPTSTYYGFQDDALSSFYFQIPCFEVVQLTAQVTVDGVVINTLKPSTVQVIQCHNVAHNPIVTSGQMNAVYFDRNAPFQRIAQGTTVTLDKRNGNAMAYVSTTRVSLVAPHVPVHFVFEHPLSSFQWLGGHECWVVSDDTGDVVATNNRTWTFVGVGCNTYCDFNASYFHSPRVGLHRLILRFSPIREDFEFEAGNGFYITTGVAAHLQYRTEGTFNYSIPTFGTYLPTVPVHMYDSCLELYLVDVVGNRIPPAPWVYVQFTAAGESHPFYSSKWHNGTVYHRICNWTIPVTHFSTFNPTLPESYKTNFTVTVSHQPYVFSKISNTMNNVTIPFAFYRTDLCLHRMQMFPVVGCAPCSDNATLLADHSVCNCDATTLVSTRVLGYDTTQVEAIQVRGRTCDSATQFFTGNGVLDIRGSCVGADAPANPLSGSTPTGVTFIQKSGRYTESPNSVLQRGYGSDTITIFTILGCNDTFIPSIGNCSVDGADLITLIGQNFPVGGVGVRITTDFSGVRLCQNVSVLNSSVMIITGCTGYGLAGRISFYPLGDAYPTIPVNSGNLTVSFLQIRQDECPRNDITNELCSNNGYCNQYRGKCECYLSNATGYWAGPSCSYCNDYYNNSFLCMNECPVGDGGFPCSHRGECWDGVCICTDSRAAGKACELFCPSSNELPCSGHGVCAAGNNCTCYQDATLGYFTGVGCSECTSGFSGPSCDQICPTDANGLICGGVGLCDSGRCTCKPGYCGAACESYGSSTCDSLICAYGSYGPSCTELCPVTNDVCSGHGNCDSRVDGTGTCSCVPRFYTADCSVQCPGNGNCSGHGVCAPSGACMCDEHFGGLDCNFTCPYGAPQSSSGTPQSLCSSQGVCIAAATILPRCTCRDTFATRDCSVLCPGNGTCSKHGICNQADATCSCFGSEREGYWMGVGCSVCKPYAAGTRCDYVCYHNATTEVPCNGNGKCTDSGCSCYGSDSTGYWTGDRCDQCRDGYFGAACRLECPGGAGNQCSGRGNCSWGVNASGVCNCSGNWTGSNCSDCLSGLYGPQCDQVCRTDCGAAGRCSAGPTGTGQCICNTGFTVDVNGSCTVCAYGYVGPNCVGCGTDASGRFCSSNGVCTPSTVSGVVVAVCACNTSWGGSVCQFQCPLYLNVTCGGGSCVANNSCACSGNQRSANGTCSLCSSGFYGIGCNQTCQACVNGTCNGGPGGDGTCVCSHGFWGPSCENVCPGGSATPCSNHGTCNVTTGLCRCSNSSTRGYYTGSNCSECQPAYASSNCSVACPTGTNGSICSGRGVCFNGTCRNCAPLSSDTAGLYCGTACQLPGSQCLGFSQDCPSGRYGSGCSLYCPGWDAASSTGCSRHGFCSPDNGTCFCDQGYFQTACDASCPLGPVNATYYAPCTGRGTCSNQGVCVCDYGYYGLMCENIGPGGIGNICSRHGTLGDDGSCTCSSGYYANDCSSSCPGVAVTGLACSGHGICTAWGSCICTADATNGFFDGSDCNSCRSGFGGGNCLTQCETATSITIGRNCSCFAGYGGASCSLECPARTEVVSTTTTVHVCNDHGVCFEGYGGNATCSCSDGYYGDACSVKCSLATCHSLGMLMATCTANGTCICLDTTEGGHWTGERCQDCKDGYYGDYCTLVCNCNQHGSCVRTTGACVCYASATLGYWTGSNCQTCSANYVGTTCTAKNVVMTPVAAATVSVPLYLASPTAPIAYYLDATYNIVYVGNDPLVVVNMTTKEVLASLSVAAGPFDGLVTSVEAFNDSYVAAKTASSPTTLTSFLVPRGHAVITSATIAPHARTPPASRVYGASASQRVLRREQKVLAVVDPTSVAQANVVGGSISAQGGGTIRIEVEATAIAWEIPFTVHQLASINSVSMVASRGLALVTGVSVLDERRIIRIRNLNSVVTIDVTIIGPYDVDIAPCYLPSSCPSYNRCDDPDSGNFLYCVVAFAAGPLFVQIVDSVSLANSPWPSTTVLLAASVTPTTIRSMSFMSELNFAFIGMEVPSLPSQVVKVDTNTMQVTSVFSATGAELVSSMTPNIVARSLSTVLITSESLRMVELTFFGVRSLAPDVVDNRGSVMITVSGEAFPNGTLYCEFGAERVSTLATFVNSTTLLCNTLATPPTSLCDPLEFNLRTVTQATNNTGVAISRPLPADLYGLTVSTGYPGNYSFAYSSSVISVSGYIFEDSPSARCFLVDPAANRTYDFPLTIVSTTLILCAQYVFVAPTRPGSYLTYSHDGVRFSTNTLPFSLVGFPNQMVVTAVGASEVLSGLVATIPQVVVKLVDSAGNTIEATQQSSLIAYATVVTTNSSTSYLLATSSASAVPFTAGAAVFSRLLLNSPVAGFITIMYSTTSGFSTFVYFTISPGTPAQIVLQNPSRSQWIVGVTAARTLSPLPLANIADAAGNRVVNDTYLPSYLQLSFTRNVYEEEQAIVSQTSVTFVGAITTEKAFEFGAVSAQTVFGVPITLVFTTPSYFTDFRIQSLAYTLDITESCSPQYYGVPRTSICDPCPLLGQCDGTTLVTVLPGNWRSSITSYEFYSCEPPYSASGSCGTGSCNTGYTGPRCSVCADGYGHSGLSCSECPSTGTSIAVIVIIAVVVIAVVVVLSLNSIRGGKEVAEGGAVSAAASLPLIVKLLVNHLQMTGTVVALSATLPSFLDNFLNGSGQAGISLNLAFFSCTLAPDAYSTYMMTILLPVGAVIVLLLVMALVSKIEIYRAVQAFKKVIAQIKDEEVTMQNRDQNIDEGVFSHCVVKQEDVPGKFLSIIGNAFDEFDDEVTGKPSKSDLDAHPPSSGVFSDDEATTEPAPRTALSGFRAASHKYGGHHDATPQSLGITGRHRLGGSVVFVEGATSVVNPTLTAGSISVEATDLSVEDAENTWGGEAEPLSQPPNTHLTPVARSIDAPSLQFLQSHGRGTAPLKVRDYFEEVESEGSSQGDEYSADGDAATSTGMGGQRNEEDFIQRVDSVNNDMMRRSRKVSEASAFRNPLKDRMGSFRSRIKQEVDTRRELLQGIHDIRVSFARNWLDFTAVATVVVLFLLYPTILLVCADMLNCETLDYGAKGTIDVLVSDRSIDCTTDEYMRYRKLALITLAVYGLGIPALCIGLVAVVGLVKGDLERAKYLFYFTTGGFKKHLWFFEVVSLLRKAVLVVLTQSIQGVTLRGNLCMWCATAFFVINVMFNPWHNPDLQLLENASLACLTVTFNLMQILVMYERTSAEANTIGIVIFVVNIVLFLVFLRRIILDVRNFVLHELSNDVPWAMMVAWVFRIRPSVDEGTEILSKIQKEIDVTEHLVFAKNNRVFALYHVSEDEVQQSLMFEYTESLREAGLYIHESTGPYQARKEAIRNESRHLSTKHSIAELVTEEQSAAIQDILMRLRTKAGYEEGFTLDPTSILQDPNLATSEPIFGAFQSYQITSNFLVQLSTIDNWEARAAVPARDANPRVFVSQPSPSDDFTTSGVIAPHAVATTTNDGSDSTNQQALVLVDSSNTLPHVHRELQAAEDILLSQELAAEKLTDALEGVYAVEKAILQRVMASVQRRSTVLRSRIVARQRPDD